MFNSVNTTAEAHRAWIVHHTHRHTLRHRYRHKHTQTHTHTHSHTHSLTHTRRAGKLKGLMETAKEKGARRFREAQQKRMNEHSKQAGSN